MGDFNTLSDFDSTAKITYNKQIKYVAIWCVIVFGIPIFGISTLISQITPNTDFETALTMVMSAYTLGNNSSGDNSTGQHSLPLFLTIILYLLGIVFISLVVALITLIAERKVRLDVTDKMFREVLDDVMSKRFPKDEDKK